MKEKVTTQDNHYNFKVKDYVDENFLFPKSENEDRQDEQLERMGFYPEKGKEEQTRYNFNANIFADYLSKVIHCVQNDNGTMYIYNLQGFYEEAESWKMGKIIKYLMCQVKDLWTLQRENASLDSYQRSLSKVVKSFNVTDNINLLNGVLDIQTGELHQHSQNFYTTIKLPIAYDPNAKCDRFLNFIKEITRNDNELSNVIQEMVGYCLCHNTKAEKAFYLYGSGKNGKSVLVKVIEALVGKENISNVSLNSLGDSFGIASMVDKNVNISSENEVNGKLNTQMFKAIVSGDTVNVTRKYKDDMQCTLATKLIMLVNSLPNTSDVTYGYFRKIIILPFDERFEGENQDVNLFEKLKLELAGILNWALVGLKRLQDNQYQFSKSKAIEKVIEEYTKSQNPTVEFFHDCYEKKEGAKIKRSEIYTDFQFWANENSVESLSLQNFWNMLSIKADEPNSNIDLKDERKIKGIRYICGYTRKNNNIEITI